MFVFTARMLFDYRAKKVAFALGIGLLFAVGNTTADELFLKQIAPILQKKCVSCHNDNDLDGGLSLQSAESFLKGGESGEIVSRGQPDASSLIDYVSGEEPEMPKDSQPLSKAEIEQIRKWIRQGAKWPKDYRVAYVTGISRDWWSLKPLARSKTPANASNPIDFFVGKQHASKGLDFAKQAERRVLIRRLYSDLIGLPPTIEEVNRFVNSKDGKAYERLVGNLLASPRYGERWA